MALIFLHYWFLCRQNASYVALEVTTLIQHHTALRPTLLMNTTWLTTCRYLFCINLSTNAGLNVNMWACFRFFLMYLINKDETEHTGQVSLNSFITGIPPTDSSLLLSVSWLTLRPPLSLFSHPLLQESYVWKMYQERCWDFFPAGDCFRKQYEDQLS